MSEHLMIKRVSEYDEIFPIIWRELDVSAGQRALDIGVGSKASSSSKMLEKKLGVVGVDIDPECRAQSEELGFPICICDACSLPFQDESFDFSIAFFTLHEIAPDKHKDVVSEMKRVARKVAIIEPLPNTHEIGKIYDQIWQKAMDSVGKFEIYQPINYWVSLLSTLNPRRISKYQIEFSKMVGKANAENFCEQSIEHFKKLGINRKFTNEIKELIEKIKIYGMKHSNVAAIIGYFDL